MSHPFTSSNLDLISFSFNNETYSQKSLKTQETKQRNSQWKKTIALMTVASTIQSSMIKEKEPIKQTETLKYCHALKSVY